MDKEEARENRRALKSLLDSAGYHYRRAGEYSYEIPFGGKYRHWEIQMHCTTRGLGSMCTSWICLQPESCGQNSSSAWPN